jgi:hypothetical protein
VVAGLAQLVSPLATFGDPRFKMPLYPTLAICAAVALAALWDAVAQRFFGSTGASRPVPDVPDAPEPARPVSVP